MESEKDKLNEDLQRYLKKGSWQNAITVLKRLSALEPDNAFYRLRIGDYFGRLSDPQTAAESYLAAGELYANGGFVVKALAAFKMALKVDANNATAHKKITGLHAHAVQQAASQLRVAVEEPPGPPPASEPPPVATPLFETIAYGDAIPPEMLEGEPVAPSESSPFAPSPVPPSPLPSPGAQPPEEPESEVYLGAPEEEPAPIESASLSSLLEPLPSSAAPSWRSADVLPLFASLTQEEFNEVAQRLEPPFSYGAGDVIVQEGDRGDSIYIIISGKVRVSTHLREEEVALGELQEGEFFGEVGFLTGRPRTANIVAATDTDILELKGDDVREIVKRFPRLRKVLEEFYIRRVKDTLKKIQSREKG